MLRFIKCPVLLAVLKESCLESRSVNKGCGPKDLLILMLLLNSGQTGQQVRTVVKLLLSCGVLVCCRSASTHPYWGSIGQAVLTAQYGAYKQRAGVRQCGDCSVVRSLHKGDAVLRSGHLLSEPLGCSCCLLQNPSFYF